MTSSTPNQNTTYQLIVTIFLSLIPGLQIWQSGKRRQTLWIWIAIVLAIGLFILFPSLATWYLICVIYLGQMVYSVWLSIWLRPEKQTKEAQLNANLGAPLPAVFQRAKKMDQVIFDALEREIRPDRDLVTAVLGLEPQSGQYHFFGVTETDLVIAACTDNGVSRNSRRIPRDQVAWVSLLIGERNCLLNIRYEDECYPSVTLHIPGKLKDSAKNFVKEFPGSWDVDSRTMEIIHSVDKLGWSPQVLVACLIGFSFVVFGLIPAKDNAILSLAKLVSFAFGFFLLAWPFLIWLLEEIKKEPALTAGNFVRAFFILPTVFYLWWMAVSPLGITLVKIIRVIRHMP